MDFWSDFWAWVLIVGLVLFALLAIAVTFGGFHDVRAMFRRLAVGTLQERDTDSD